MSDGPPLDAERDLSVEIEPAIARGTYSNLVLVNRTRTELTIDFAYLQPGDRAIVQARVILAPANARELIGLLTAQLDADEADAGANTGEAGPSGPRSPSP